LLIAIKLALSSAEHSNTGACLGIYPNILIKKCSNASKH